MKKIAIIGPESTGKSTLSKGLAKYYNEPFVSEYGRKYLEEKGPQYTESDLLAISMGMLHWENQMAKTAKNLLFCDTDLIMMKVWYEVKFNTCHPWVLDQLDKKPYDFYLLCKPDLPWEADPFRENPHIREELFEQYLLELQHYKLPFFVVEGEERIQLAIKGIEEFLKENN